MAKWREEAILIEDEPVTVSTPKWRSEAIPLEEDVPQQIRSQGITISAPEEGPPLTGEVYARPFFDQQPLMGAPQNVRGLTIEKTQGGKFRGTGATGDIPSRIQRRSRFDDAIDRAASGMAMVGSAGAEAMAAMTKVSGQIPSPYMRPKAKVDEDVAKLKKSAEFLWEVSKDPALAAQNTDLVSKAFNLAAETVPYITATSVATIATGPFGGFAVGSMVEGNSAHKRAIDHFLEINKGKPLTEAQEKQAKYIGAGVGIAAGAIEAYGGNYVQGFLENVASKISNKALRTGAVFGVGTVVEALEEGSQEIAAIAGESTYRDVNWKEGVNRTLGSMAGGAFLGGVMKGGSIAISPMTDMAQPKPPLLGAKGTVDTSGMHPVPTEKPPQIPITQAVTPQKPIIETPVGALKPPTSDQMLGKEQILGPAKQQGQETGRVETEVPAKVTEVKAAGEALAEKGEITSIIRTEAEGHVEDKSRLSVVKENVPAEQIEGLDLKADEWAAKWQKATDEFISKHPELTPEQKRDVVHSAFTGVDETEFEGGGELAKDLHDNYLMPASKEYIKSKLAPAEAEKAVKQSARSKTPAKSEFKIGDVIDTKGRSNMSPPVTIREIKGNTLKFTDAKGVEYAGMARADVRRLIEGGAWERVNPEALAQPAPMPAWDMSKEEFRNADWENDAFRNEVQKPWLVTDRWRTDEYAKTLEGRDILRRVLIKHKVGTGENVRPDILAEYPELVRETPMPAEAGGGKAEVTKTKAEAKPTPQAAGKMYYVDKGSVGSFLSSDKVVSEKVQSRNFPTFKTFDEADTFRKSQLRDKAKARKEQEAAEEQKGYEEYKTRELKKEENSAFLEKVSSEFYKLAGDDIPAKNQLSQEFYESRHDEWWDKPLAEKKQELADFIELKKSAVVNKPKAETPEQEVEGVTHEPETTEEAIVEPKPSAEIQQGQAGPTVSLEPTGTLDPTKHEDALKIIEQHKEYLQDRPRRMDVREPYGLEGIYKLGWKDRAMFIEEVLYSSEQVDKAYRTVQTDVPSGQAGVSLFAMPGKEKDMVALAVKMAKMKVAGPRKPTMPSIGRPRQLPNAKTKKEDFIKAIRVASAKETSTYAISGVLVEGENLIATDGRRLFIAKGKWGKDGVYTDKASLSKGVLGKTDKSGLKFPKWQDIFPDYPKTDAVILKREDISNAFRRLKQASTVTTEESKGILVILNKDGSLGFAASAPEVGHTEINVLPGGKILGAVNPSFLMDALEFHAVRGDNYIEFYFPIFDRPILTIGPHEKTKTLTMPINAGEPSTELKETITEEEPTPKAEVAKEEKGGKEVGPITTAEKDALRAKGYSVAEILKMTPQEAKAKLGEEKPPTEPPTGESEAGFIEFPFDMPEPRKLRAGLESIYQHYINRFASIENAVKKARKLGMKILPGENPGVRAREYLGLSHKVGSMLERNTFRITKDGQIEITGEGLKPILLSFDKEVKPLEGRRKIREKDFETYLFAQRTILDLQRPVYEGAKRNIVSPEQVAAAQADLARLKVKYKDAGIASFESHAKRLYEFQKRILHLLVDSGNLSQKQYDKISGQNKHYIPFDRILEESDAIEQGGVPGTKKGFQKTTAPVRKIKGSELEKQPAIESIIRNTYRIADEAEKNTIRKGLAKLASVLPDEINPIRIKMMPIRVDPKEILTVVREFRTASQQVIKESKTIIAEGKADLSGPAAKLEKIVRESLTHRGFSEAEANSFIAQIRKGDTGKAESVTTERIQQTIKEVQKILISQEPVESTIFRPSQFAPKGRTLEYFENGKRKYIQLSKNLYEAMTGLSETSSGLFVKVFAKPAHWLRIGATITPEFMVRNPIRDQWTAAMQTSFGFVPFVDSIGAMADVLGKTEAYHDWLRSGGAYSGFVELNRPALKKAVEELRGVTARKMLKKLNVIADAQDISQLFEQATRLGVFKAARRRGLSAVEAGFEAREATVDFNVRGSQTKDVNQVIAFLGAGVQGLDKTIRTTIKSPISTTIKGLVLITLPSLLLYLRNRDEENYKELPRWQRDLFWLFKINGVWIRIPKPFLYGQVFGSLPERFMEYLDTKDPKALKDFKKSVYDSVLPVSGDPEAGLLATAIKPLIENAVNWNFFMQRPLVPEGKEDLLPPEQYGRYTTETAKQLGQWFNYSPAKIENLIRGWFGGTGTYALEYSDKLVKDIRRAEGITIAGERPKTLSDIPGVKGFVARPPLSNPESLREFYDNLNELGAAYQTYRKNPQPETKVKYPGLILAPQLRQQADIISTITKSIDRIATSKLPDKEKNRRIEALELRRLALAKRMNDLVDNARRKSLGIK